MRYATYAFASRAVTPVNDCNAFICRRLIFLNQYPPICSGWIAHNPPVVSQEKVQNKTEPLGYQGLGFVQGRHAVLSAALLAPGAGSLAHVAHYKRQPTM